MATKEKLNEMRDAQRARISACLIGGESVQHICAVEGVDENTVKAVRKTLRQRGHKLPNKGRSPVMPYGLTQISANFRNRLGSVLNRIVEKDRRLEPIEAAAAVGVPVKLQKNTWTGAVNYDWKLSEMERLARFHHGEDVDFVEFMLLTLQPAALGATKEKVQRWNDLMQAMIIGRSAVGSTSTS